MCVHDHELHGWRNIYDNIHGWIWKNLRNVCKDVWSWYLSERSSEFIRCFIQKKLGWFVNICKYKLYLFFPFRFQRNSLMNSLMPKMTNVGVKALSNYWWVITQLQNYFRMDSWTSSEVYLHIYLLHWWVLRVLGLLNVVV